MTIYFEKYKKQLPEEKENWLYKDMYDTRKFAKEVCMPIDAEPWAECTNEEKEAWEREHPQPEPQEGEG